MCCFSIANICLLVFVTHYQMISETDIPQLLADKVIHLAKTPMVSQPNTPIQQMYVLGYNAGGRPDGFWFSNGSDWFAKAAELANPLFPLCCYIYHVELDYKSILTINSSNFEAFDKEFPSWWLNMDYYEIDFLDYLTKVETRAHRRRHLNVNKLRRHPGESFKETLLANGVIFDNAESAKTNCAYYRRDGIVMDRYRYKDWNAVAAKYKGVIFQWDASSPEMKYLWWQSLDVSSGCIWDMSAISSTRLLYNKISESQWQKNDK